MSEKNEKLDDNQKPANDSNQEQKLDSNQEESGNTELSKLMQEAEALRKHNEKLIAEKREIESKYKEVKELTTEKEKEELKKTEDFKKLWELTQKELESVKGQFEEKQKQEEARHAELIAEKYLNRLEEKLGGSFYDRKIAKKEVDYSGAVLDPKSGDFLDSAVTEEANRILKELNFLVKPKNPSIQDDKGSKDSATSQKSRRNWKEALKDIV